MTEGGDRPVIVWVVYGLGIFAGVVLVGSALFAAVVSLTSSGTTVNISGPALVICIVLIGAAVALKIWRSTRGST